MRRFLKPFFTKKIFSTLFFVMQLILIAVTITGIYETSAIVTGGLTILSVIVILYEINREADPDVKIVWIILVALVPLFGVFLYVYVHLDAFMRILRRKLNAISAKVSKIAENYTCDRLAIKDVEPDEYGLFNYLGYAAHAPAFQCSDIKYFRLGEHMYESIIEDVEKAQRYVFIEMFIINENDYMWNRLLNILIEKARRGVEVRIMYDAMGSLTCTRKELPQILKNYGIKCCVFSPVKPFLSSYHNNRDHRKIIIIDGKCAYTGGVNLADEYINEKKRFGHWKDTAVRVSGEGVRGFLLMYFKLWNLSYSSVDDYNNYLLTVPREEKTHGYMCAFDDTPFDGQTVSKNVYLHIINHATNYVYIYTPYLVLGSDLRCALQFAAERGVDVRIYMPHIPDKWYAFAVGRTYYPHLIRAGVKIYEYTPGFLHAKTAVSDDIRAYVGSANLDFRSLYQNFECGLYIYDNEVIDKIKFDFEHTTKESEEFTLKDYKNLNIFYRIAGRILKFFAPLL